MKRAEMASRRDLRGIRAKRNPVGTRDTTRPAQGRRWEEEVGRLGWRRKFKVKRRNDPTRDGSECKCVGR